MIGSVKRAAEVLRALAASPGGVGARELAARIGASKSTAQRLLQALQESELVTQDPRTRRYRLGPLVASLGLVYLAGVDVRTVALPRMARLRDELGETVSLNVRLGDERIYIAQLESNSQLRTKAELGKPYPLWSGAPGRVLLAGLDPGEVDRILTEATFTAFTEHTPVRPADILARLDEARTHGYVEAFEETITGANTIAAPIHDHSGAVVAALSVSGPATRFGPAEMAAARATLLATTAAISTELGAPARTGGPSIEPTAEVVP